MKKDFSTQHVFFLLGILLAANTSIAQTKEANPERQLTTFTSSNGLLESCIALAKLPLGNYKNKDLDEEKQLCTLDFYNNKLALCPKAWSTSPGTIINEIGGAASTSLQAENSMCGKKSPLKSLAKYKQTMNGAETSGTFSASAILYYHFSRALDTTVDIPVAVYRSMDKDAHYARVTSRANPPANAKMNIAGWKLLAAGEKNPSAYQPTSDLFTQDRKQIYGAMVKDQGSRYGDEINGTRASGWGQGQNYDFQRTPAFLALKSSKPSLLEAIDDGVATAFVDPKMRQAFSGQKPSAVQMVLWMNEVSEIAILDYIFSQQDRIGNIDYRWYWMFQEGNETKAIKVSDDKFEDTARVNMSKIPMPPEIANKNPVLVQKTMIGDNDAGGLVNYANFSKSTGMLHGSTHKSFGSTKPILHLNPETYERLLKLAQDFKAKGANYNILNREVRLLGYSDAGDKRFLQLIGNTLLAAQILQNNCHAGILKLDIVSAKQAARGIFQVSSSSCDIK